MKLYLFTEYDKDKHHNFTEVSTERPDINIVHHFLDLQEAPSRDFYPYMTLHRLDLETHEIELLIDTAKLKPRKD